MKAVQLISDSTTNDFSLFGCQRIFWPNIRRKRMRSRNALKFLEPLLQIFTQKVEIEVDLLKVNK